jgi:ligand-binding sensor domain-containing protein/signal transduction histidine kinase
VVQASSRTIIPGIPEMVIAKDGYSKEQNPQNFSSFTKQEGLKSNNVVCMKQDRNGNIWFGTWEGGVSRYDGKYFTHFAEKEGLAGNIVLSIYEDKSGNLWFAGGGVSRYDGKYFTQFTNIEVSNNLVLSVFEDDSANLWFGAEKGLTKYNGKTFTNYTTKEGLSNNTVWSILEDKSGSLWFGTSGGVSSYDGKTFTNYTEKEGLSNNNVSSIYEDKAGSLWFGTNRGVSRLDRDSKTFTYYTEKEGLSNNNVSSIYEDKAGNLWIGTYGGGVSKYDGTTFTNFTEQDGLANNLVTSILEDRSGSLWFGIDRGGVSKYNGRTFTHFGRTEGLSSNDCTSIFEDNSGNLWFGTNHGGVSKYDGKSFANFTQEDGPDNVLSTLEDDYGNLWFGCLSGGVFKFKHDGKSFTHFTLKEGLYSDNVTKILQDKTGSLWVATGGGGEGGISKYDGKTFTHYTDKEGLSSNDVWSILQDKSGNFWFGTNRGVSRLNGDDKSFTHFTAKEGLSANLVSCIIEDKSGNFWFGTDGGGVSRLDRDGTTFTHFTEKEGLSNNNVQSIFEDRSGNLWFGTALGLNKLSAKSLLNLSANNSSEAALIKSYTYEDGFLGIRCNHSAIFEDKNGTIWIGTEDRLTAYHPEGDKGDTIEPNMQLTSVALFNENIPWQNLDQKKDTNIILGNGVVIKQFQFDSLSKWYNIPQDLSLAYNNNYLTFNFVGITTKSPQKVKYQYKLEGSDENWSTLTTRNEATYGNLPPANYTFKVRSMNSDGYWSKEVSYYFTIRPPWWKTWWAYTLYIVAFVAAVASFIAYRSRKLRLENRILEEKVSQRTIQLEQKSIELGRSLDNLKSTQAQLIQSEKMASLGELTAGIAHEIQNPLNFVNNFSDVNSELINEAGQEMEKGNFGEVKTILNDIKLNEEKINHHGKRADAIVKGMLQHSKQTSGIKEPTDINALADEYLRLSYHGIRAKDKTFNATMKTDFDNSIGKINLVPQDIGRVILNLINNAFYAVNEKARLHAVNYEPLVLVSTKKLNGRVELTVKDNGNGIPQKIVEKIFQPFFTTKPTGQGTGLGLSLAYDIIKAHGGEIKLDTKEGEGSEFIIQLPVS